MILSAEQVDVLAHYVVAVNAQGWELDHEDWPGLDVDQAAMLNDAIVGVGNFLARVAARDEAVLGIDVRDVAQRAMGVYDEVKS